MVKCTYCGNDNVVIYRFEKAEPFINYGKPILWFYCDYCRKSGEMKV